MVPAGFWADFGAAGFLAVELACPQQPLTTTRHTDADIMLFRQYLFVAPPHSFDEYHVSLRKSELPLYRPQKVVVLLKVKFSTTIGGTSMLPSTQCGMPNDLTFCITTSGLSLNRRFLTAWTT